MSISALFIRRPVTTVLVMAMILFFGISAYRRLPVSDLPAVDFPTITVNAVLPVGVVMTRMIREYETRTGYAIGFKPAGGIRTAKQSLEYLFLMKEELGDRWLKPDLFRFGASGLLTDIERQLEHFVTGRYSAAHRHPMV